MIWKKSDLGLLSSIWWSFLTNDLCEVYKTGQMDQNKQSKREDFCLYNVEKCILGIRI